MKKFCTASSTSLRYITSNTYFLKMVKIFTARNMSIDIFKKRLTFIINNIIIVFDVGEKYLYKRENKV